MKSGTENVPYFWYQISLRETQYKNRYRKINDSSTENLTEDPKSAKTPILHTTKANTSTKRPRRESETESLLYSWLEQE